MNIAIFTDTYYPEVNGIAVTTKILVETLKAHGDNVVVVTGIHDDKEPNKEANVYYVRCSIKNKGSVFTTVRNYNLTTFKHIKNFKPDIIHNQTNGHIGQLGIYTSTKLHVPFIYTYHIHREEYAPYVGSNFFIRIARARERRYFKMMTELATEFIAPSVKIKNYLRKKDIDKYINVVPSGIEMDKFIIDENTKKDGKYIKKKYDIKDGEKVLLYVGALSREKNIDLLLNSFRKYIDEVNNKTHLLIVGEGDQTDNLLGLIKQLDLKEYVHLVGKVNHDKIKSYYALSDVYVSSSTSETQNISIMEAMASRCLCLAISDESLLGIIEEEKTGFTFTDEDDFSSKLKRILKMDEKEINEIKENAYNLILNKFSLEKYYENTIEVYKRAQRKNW